MIRGDHFYRTIEEQFAKVEIKEVDLVFSFFN